MYAVEFSHRSGRDLINVAKKRTNIIPIIEDARHPHKYRMLMGEWVWWACLYVVCAHGGGWCGLVHVPVCMVYVSCHHQDGGCGATRSVEGHQKRAICTMVARLRLSDGTSCA